MDAISTAEAVKWRKGCKNTNFREAKDLKKKKKSRGVAFLKAPLSREAKEMYEKSQSR
jgi:hypothetical protein